MTEKSSAKLGCGGLTESHLGANIDIRYVLVLAKKRQVEQNGQRRGVRSENDQLADSAVEGFGSLVGTLLQLAVVGPSILLVICQTLDFVPFFPKSSQLSRPVAGQV
jgi:hypothetical protein